MKAASFDYYRPETLAEALDLLAQYGADARVLAGGQSLLPQLNLRALQPRVLIDINRIDVLRQLDRQADELSVGATVRQIELQSASGVAANFAYLADALSHVSSAPIKHRGTVVGSLAYADPAAELPAVALCTEATLIAIAANNGERRIAASDFFVGQFDNALRPEELCHRAIFRQLPSNHGLAIEQTQRRYNGVAIAGAIANVAVEHGRFSSLRVVMFGIARTPVLASKTSALTGCSIDDSKAISAACSEDALALTETHDVLASLGYRRHAVAVLARRALVKAATIAAGAISS